MTDDSDESGMGGLFDMAMQMQQQMAAAQEELHSSVVEGQSGGGMVRIEVTGAMEFRSVTIDPQVVDPDDVELLADLVLAALHDAVSKTTAMQTNAMGPFGGLDLANMDLGGLGGSLDLPDIGSLLGIGMGDGDEDDEDEDIEDDDGDDGDDDVVEMKLKGDRRMGVYAAPVEELIDELGRLPGIGPKSAQRIAFYLLKVPEADAARLASAITEVKARVSFCTRCFNISEGDLCAICRDAQRDTTMLCVVEEARDIVSVERTNEYRGQYHVLGGAISPIEGIGPDQLRVKELLSRIDAEPVAEVILCTNPNIEGEATAMYLARLLAPMGLRVTRLASGLPVGGDLEYADELTLGRAFEGRRRLDVE